MNIKNLSYETSCSTLFHHNEMEFTLKNGQTVAATLSGDPTKPIVIALHGWLDNANSFSLITSLMPDYRVLALDLPGHGLSQHIAACRYYYPWEDAIVVKEIMEIIEANQLSPQRQYALIGHSAGGGVATILASTFPNKVHKCILIDSLGLAFTTELDHLIKHFTSTVRRADMAASLTLDGHSSENLATFNNIEQAIIEREEGFSGKLSIEAATVLTHRSLKQVAGGYRWRYDPKLILQPAIQLTQSHAESFIAAIKVDVLVILGDKGLFGEGQGNKRLLHFINAKVHTLEGGHHLHLESAKEQVAALINQFLSTVPDLD
ncbi:alpha/beta hydrolase [Shewanella sp. D64]|uniref:alpha/beta fold hydrolase n=1 Tax=unclassified Shewanella TaxID=196818 RepID=UPI0022BA4C70|nr:MULTISPECIES: alpha/beta hydrolase [unclassified Shewanella]MEC4724473.1 alpha/beta hydrolase [Shewanella sp. D64]MEC4736750.1 alpha/beta hydrolase [Shewanella sp. E94]WBJ94584.1 alpha/beta hydrolase [Shewanella sp. MTB7]